MDELRPKSPRRRVACYVVRGASGGGRVELLEFDHLDMPEAGTQVPAGGTQPGEGVEDAALREVLEESGLMQVSVVRRLGVSQRPHVQTGAPQHTTFVLMRYDGPRDSCGQSWVREVGGGDEDAGLRFRCWFEALPLRFELAGHQGEYLHRIQDQP
jgi:ADP-ribose pyrophosphatase YjhB (NUDIX family)